MRYGVGGFERKRVGLLQIEALEGADLDFVHLMANEDKLKAYHGRLLHLGRPWLFHVFSKINFCRGGFVVFICFLKVAFSG